MGRGRPGLAQDTAPGGAPGWLLLAAAGLLVLVAAVLALAPLPAADDAAAPPDPPEETTHLWPGPSQDPGDTPDPVPTDPGVAPDPAAEALRPWVQECRQRVGDTEFAGTVTYPATLRADLDQTVTYQAVVTLEESDLAAEEVVTIPEGDAAERQIRVQCVVGARLLPVGDEVMVDEDPEALGGGWVNRRFTGSGSVDWSWTVTPTVPEDQQVQLQLRPTLAIDDGTQTIPASSVTTFVTTIDVQGTLVQRVAHWFDQEWPRVTGVALALGLAVLAVLTWWHRVRKAARPAAAGGGGADERPSEG